MTNKQKMAISYAISERAKARRAAFIVENEGNLESFKKSKYKSMFWYIFVKYGKRIY